MNLEKITHSHAGYPAPTDGHGLHSIDDLIEPKCVSGDFMQQKLVDVLANEDVYGKFYNVLYALNEKDGAEDNEDI